MKRNNRLEFLRKRVLNKEIGSRKKHSKPIELIVKTEFKKRDWLAKELGRVGKVTRVFSAIPYLSFLCDAADAYDLNQVFRRLADDRAYKSIAAAISVIDVSNTFSIPSITKNANRGKSSELWNLGDIGAYEAQRIALGEGVKVAIIDTGVDYNHPEVSGSFGSVRGYDFVRNVSDPMDFNGHGTHVAGIALGRNYGIARASVVYAVRVLDEAGMGSEADTIAGMDWADKQDADVVNLSLGSPYASAALEDMCYYLANKGTLIVAAAGNSGFGPNYPAAFGEPVIAVAAVDEQNRHAGFSNVYETNDISAPGVDIVSSYNGGYASLSGTSMAAPHVTGSLALVLSALKSNRDLGALMEDTAQNLEEGSFPERDVYGAGLLRVDLMAKAVVENRMKSPFHSYGRKVVNVLKGEVVNVLKGEVVNVLKEVLWGE
ncbi:S8 family peptidase [Candidatus Woesearchaeota archaeon]|nr:S8 family peptidase [Candidatus Woesearchaeota archaeon]